MIDQLTQSSVARIEEIAKAESPNEACGFVLAVNRHEVVMQADNRSTNPQSTFLIAPKAYEDAKARGEIIAVWHSHTGGATAKASDSDMRQCEATQLPWFIYSVGRNEWNRIEPSGYEPPLIGRSWVDGVLDCYALIQDYYSQTLGIELPDFHREGYWWNEGQNLYLDHYVEAGFASVPLVLVRAHDILLMQWSAPVPHHGAVYVGDNKILHHLHGALSCRQTFGDYWRSKVHTVCRHHSLMKLRDPYIDKDGMARRWQT